MSRKVVYLKKEQVRETEIRKVKEYQSFACLDNVNIIVIQ